MWCQRKTVPVRGLYPHAENQGNILSRGTIVNRTYGTHKKLPGIYSAIFTNNIRPYLLWSPVIATHVRLHGYVRRPTETEGTRREWDMHTAVETSKMDRTRLYSHESCFPPSVDHNTAVYALQYENIVPNNNTAVLTFWRTL